MTESHAGWGLAIVISPGSWEIVKPAERLHFNSFFRPRARLLNQLTDQVTDRPIDGPALTDPPTDPWTDGQAGHVPDLHRERSAGPGGGVLGGAQHGRRGDHGHGPPRRVLHAQRLLRRLPPAARGAPALPRRLRAGLPVHEDHAALGHLHQLQFDLTRGAAVPLIFPRRSRKQRQEQERKRKERIDLAVDQNRRSLLVSSPDELVSRVPALPSLLISMSSAPF